MATVGEPDRPRPLHGERPLLWLSTASSAVFAVFAIAWGWWADSQLIVLDGMYVLIGVLLGGLSLQAAALIERGPTTGYPFGREALAPAVVGMQGLVLIGALGYAGVDALRVIATGGSETQLGAALLYSVVSAAVSVAVWLVLRRARGSSELVAAEAAAWLAGLLLSLGMFAGFLVAIVAQGTGAEVIVPYVDPGLVVLAVLAIAPTPVRMLREVYREMLEAAAPSMISGPIEQAVAEVSGAYGLPHPTMRISKLGRKVYVEIDYLVAEGSPWSISDADRIRRELSQRLRDPARTLWIRVELHTDPEWDTW